MVHIYDIKSYKKVTAKKEVIARENTTKIMMNSSNWVFSQISGISTVKLDEDGYTVLENFTDHINENNNAWSNEILEQYYKTFICGHNFLEHEQIEKKSYGFIVDAKIRDVDLGGGEINKYVDLLIATAKSGTPNDKIAIEIANGNRAKWSMGCSSSSIRCSKCGTISADDNNDCKHVKYDSGKKYITNKGKKSKIAILVSNLNEEDELNTPTGWVRFIEMSSVKDPAFKGAVSSHVLDIDDGKELYFEIEDEYFNREDFNGCKQWISKQLVSVIK